MDQLLDNLGSDDFADDWDEGYDGRSGNLKVIVEDDIFPGDLGDDDLEGDTPAVWPLPIAAASLVQEDPMGLDHGTVDCHLQPSSPDPYYEPASAMPDVVPATVAFVCTRTHLPVPAASKEAVERARQLLASVDADADVDSVWSSDGPATHSVSTDLLPLPVTQIAHFDVAKGGTDLATEGVQGKGSVDTGSEDIPSAKSIPRSTEGIMERGVTEDAVTKDEVEAPSAWNGSISSTSLLAREDASDLQTLADVRPALSGVKHNMSNPMHTPRHQPARFKPPSSVASKPEAQSETPRRGMSLGMTPRHNRPLHAKPFKTPFKRDADGEPRSGCASKNSSVLLRASGHQSISPKRKEAKASHRHTVFDLNMPTSRISMAAYGLQPGRSIQDLRNCHLPDELIFMTLEQASRFRFREREGWQEAANALQNHRASHSTEKWVRNHWSLILWKLASMARAAPGEWTRWWAFDKVVHQLMYRYEREINCAQRSAIKRIQERDSSAEQPMVLCVTSMKTKSNDQGQSVICLELTDGWYCIDAIVNEPIERACRKGKIKVGCKLAVVGAKIDSTSKEGEDVLDAWNHSRLIICGNSTSLAPWDARLGFQKLRPAATLRSLTADGGRVACLEFTLEKLHPIAFSDISRFIADPSGEKQKPWGEAEEALKQVQWERCYQEATEKVAAHCARQSRVLEDLAERLETVAEARSASVVSGPPGTDANSDADTLVEQLLEEPQQATAIIKSLAKHQLTTAARTLRQQLVTGASIDGPLEVESICPRRQVRSFRIAMVSESFPLKGRLERTAQLTVWDCQDLPPELLKAGGRYRVTHLIPNQLRSWAKKVDINNGEVFLSTTRQSRFARIE